MAAWDFGEHVEGLDIEGRPVRAAVFDEHRVRAAAGLTLATGAAAFAYAALGQIYAPIQAVTVFFFVEFALRLIGGLRVSPFGIVAGWLVRQPPQWVSAKPKRFAWSLGAVMAGAMALISNVGIRGAVPLSICLVCLVLMWLEAVLGLCLGCEIHAWMVRRGWVRRDLAFEICSGGACRVEGAR